MTGPRVAWAFLTRLPGGTHPGDERAMAAAVPWFPAVGVMVGGLLGLAWLGLVELVAPTTAALLVVGLGAALTGAFHEDGLADTADSFGGYDAERRLAIMRDSRIGTFGAFALMVGTGLKVVALARLDGPDGCLALVLAHGLGRTTALGVMWAGPEARPDGLAAAAADIPRRAVAGLVVAVLVASLAVGPSSAVAAGFLVVLAVSALALARRAYGGTTGDVLGAVEQLGEIVVLTIAAEMAVDPGWLWS